MRELAFKLYLFYLCSFFLHFTARLPALGSVRFDFLIVLCIIGFLVLGASDKKFSTPVDYGGTGKYLKYIIVFIVLSLPFVEWPGSVLSAGIINFIKAIIFYYFTVLLVDTENKLKKVIYVFMACQVIRVLEPMFLNITQGYWGSSTYLNTGEFASRLSGAPSDIINPNELGYVVVTVIIWLYYLFLGGGRKLWKIVALVLILCNIYALILTASRSAFLALLIAAFIMFWMSERKALFSVVAIIAVIGALMSMGDFHRDRYLSLFSSDTKGAETAQGRLDSLIVDFEVALNRPFVGHGLGTSAEANYNIRGKGQISHNLYLEVAAELGFIGLWMYLLFLKSIIQNLKILLSGLAEKKNDFLYAVTRATFVWSVVTMFFSFAQYGLSIYAIYFIAGLTLVISSVTNPTSQFENDRCK